MTLTRYLSLACVMLMSLAALAADDTRHIVLLHVNDSHGHTMSFTADGVSVGGYARLASVVQQVRDEVGADHVLLFHAGDEFSRGDALTSATGGAANIAIMNQIGFSLFVPGNGEFYPGVANLQKRIGEAKFPVLASNVSYRIGGKPLADVTHQFNVAGVRIGVMGLCFLHKEHPSSLPLSVEDPIVTAKQLVPELRKDNDLVISVDHLGLDQDRALAAAVPGIDVIIGGHSHTTLPRGHWVNQSDHSTLIVQAGDLLRFVGRVDLRLRRTGDSWQLTDASATLIPLDQTVREDPAIKATIARLWPTTQPTTTPMPAISPARD